MLPIFSGILIFLLVLEEKGIEALPKGQCFFRHFPTLPYGGRDFADR